MKTAALKDKSLFPELSVPVSLKQPFAPRERVTNVQPPCPFFLGYCMWPQSDSQPSESLLSQTVMGCAKQEPRWRLSWEET